MSEGELQQPQPSQEMTPLSVDEIISGLKGFGIEDFEEILTLNAGGRTVRLRISNIPSGDEMDSMLAAEGAKGYLWVQRVKCEIISRAISWIDGVNLRKLSEKERVVTDPTDRKKKDVQIVLRNLIMGVPGTPNSGWGKEIADILWKVVCVHSQSIEDRLVKSFPDAAIMTEVEKRFLESAIRDITEASQTRITEQVEELAKEEPTQE